MQHLRRIPIEPRPRPIIPHPDQTTAAAKVQHHLINRRISLYMTPTSSRFRIQFIVKHSLTAANLVGGFACDLYGRT
jgi:hypothetical protein